MSVIWKYCLVVILFPVASSIPEGSIRLSQSNAEFPHSGFIEVYIKQQWMEVYDTNWTLTDADIVCKQLGYAAASQILDEKYFCRTRQWMNRYIITNVECEGSEVTLSQCEYSINYTALQSDSPCGVVCAVPLGVRLVGTTDFSSGILELLFNNVWTPVCGEIFDYMGADVACRELGFQYGDWTDVVTPKGELIFSNVTCSGDEFSLSTCLGGEGGNDFELINCQSAIQLNCLGSPFQPCHMTSIPLSCDTVLLIWSPPPYPHPSQVEFYTVWQRILYDANTIWNELSESVETNTRNNELNITISGLKPFTVYEFQIQGSSEYGNGSISDSVVAVTMTPVLPKPVSLNIDSTSAKEANLSWQMPTITCSLLRITSFDIQLTRNSNSAIIIHSYPINKVLIIDNEYFVQIEELQPMTSYDITVRAVACLQQENECSEDLMIIIGPFSLNSTLLTLEDGTSSFLEDTFLSNPYISLILFIIIISLVVLLLALLPMLCICAITHRHCKKKTMNQTITDEETYNIYSAGDLSEQSYIPMISSITGSVTRRRSSNAVNQPGFWIDLPESNGMTTFRDNTEEQRSTEFNISPLRMGMREGEREREREIEEVDNDYEDDNPYDVIPAHESGKYVEGDRETTIERDEEEDDIYDEIPHQSPNLSQTSSISKEDILPNAPLSQVATSLSQEPTDHPIIPAIPPPREFAALPTRKSTLSGYHESKEEKDNVTFRGLSVSMVNLPLPIPPQLPSPMTHKEEPQRQVVSLISQRRGSRDLHVIPSTRRTISSDVRGQRVDKKIRDLERSQSDKWRTRVDNVRIPEPSEIGEQLTHRKLRSNSGKVLEPRKKRESLTNRKPGASGRVVKPKKRRKSISKINDESPYYSIPPDSKTISMKISSDKDDERSSSPEYEVLIHPNSSALGISNIAIKSNENKDTLTTPQHTSAPLDESNIITQYEEGTNIVTTLPSTQSLSVTNELTSPEEDKNIITSSPSRHRSIHLNPSVIVISNATALSKEEMNVSNNITLNQPPPSKPHIPVVIDRPLNIINDNEVQKEECKSEEETIEEDIDGDNDSPTSLTDVKII